MDSVYEAYDTSEFRISSLERRIVAYILDYAVISGFTTIILGILYISFENFSLYNLNVILAVLVIVVYFMSFFYFIACEATMNQTLGKIIVGIYVLKPDLSLPSFENIVLRNLLRVFDSSVDILMLLFIYSEYIGIPIFLIYPIAVISLIRLTKYRQRVGDLFADTVVVQRLDKRPLIVATSIDEIEPLKLSLSHLHARFASSEIPKETYDYYREKCESKIHEFSFLKLKEELECELL